MPFTAKASISLGRALGLEQAGAGTWGCWAGRPCVALPGASGSSTSVETLGLCMQQAKAAVTVAGPALPRQPACSCAVMPPC